MRKYIYPEAKLTQSEELIEMETTISKLVKGTKIANETKIVAKLGYSNGITDGKIRTCRQILNNKVDKFILDAKTNKAPGA